MRFSVKPSAFAYAGEQSSRIHRRRQGSDASAPLEYDGRMLGQLAHQSNDVERLGQMFERAPGFMALVEGTDLKFVIASQAFQKLVGRNDLIGKGLAEAFPELDEQGVDDILKGVGRSGEAFVAH